jgi:hypothetical protein
MRERGKKETAFFVVVEKRYPNFFVFCSVPYLDRLKHSLSRATFSLSLSLSLSSHSTHSACRQYGGLGRWAGVLRESCDAMARFKKKIHPTDCWIDGQSTHSHKKPLFFLISYFQKKGEDHCRGI